GLLHRERQDPTAARQDFEQGIALDPRCSKIHFELGCLLYNSQHYEDALRALDTALANTCNDPPSLLYRAQVLLQLAKAEEDEERQRQRYLEVIQTCDRYLKQGKDLVPVYLFRAEARAKLRDYAGFIDDHTRALELKPDSVLYAERGWAYLANEAPR